MRRSATGVVLALTLCAATPAQAHLVNSGLGPFYDGALHLLFTPMDLIGLGTLCLFVGSQGAEASRLLVAIAPIAWLLAGAIGFLSGVDASFALVNASMLIVLGGSVALDLKTTTIVTTIAAAACGGLLGLQSGLELRSADADWVALMGSVAVVLAMTILVSSLLVSNTDFPFRVIVRVLGSWAAATGLLSIGWIVEAG